MIALKLRIVLILMSLLILIYVLYKIRKSKLNITDSIYWVIFSGLLLILEVQFLDYGAQGTDDSYLRWRNLHRGTSSA